MSVSVSVYVYVCVSVCLCVCVCVVAPGQPEEIGGFFDVFQRKPSHSVTEVAFLRVPCPTHRPE
eukprot:3251937-Rhodomonas_salina.1